MPFRRSSDTTSDSGSDDFKLERAEELSSSFSRGSSSESCHSYGATSRSYHCIRKHTFFHTINQTIDQFFVLTVKDLNEINHLERSPAHPELNVHQQQSTTSAANNESLQDFRSRLNCRRKVKTRQAVFSAYDDDRTDNSCDSTTTKAHEDILRSANLLKQEQADEIGLITTRLTRSDLQQQQSISSLAKEVQSTSTISTTSSSSANATSFAKRSFVSNKSSEALAGVHSRSADESIL